ncbi:MAG: type I-G CRISPR-associated RAMP protein Csb1/Cas7g [Methylococcaceae bacterium]
MNYSELCEIVKTAHALSFHADYIPVDSPSDAAYFRVSPPTYAAEKKGDPSHYLITDQGEVRLDSPQSFANRLENRILEAGITPHFQIINPDDGTVLLDSRELAHRCFDAYIRDSNLNDQPFFKSEIGLALQNARAKNATAVFCCSPESLLFGAWDSHTGKGVLAARWRRCVTARIYGTNAKQRPGGTQKNDPLGITLDTGKMYLSAEGQITLDPALATDEKENKKTTKTVSKKTVDAEKSTPKSGKKATELGYGSIPGSNPDGVDVEKIVLQGAIHLGELRKYAFPTEKGEAEDRDKAARTALAALALWSVHATATDSLSLRSGCDLTYTEMNWLVRYGGGRDEAITLDNTTAMTILTEAIAALKQYDLAWNTKPINLVASKTILEMACRSR